MGTSVEGKRILFECDCEPVVSCINKGYSKSGKLCALLRELATSAIAGGFVFRAVHIPGKQNIHADLLSRGRVQDFLARSAFSQSSRTFLPGQSARS